MVKQVEIQTTVLKPKWAMFKKKQNHETYMQK